MYGLFLDGAAWDYEFGILSEAAPKQLFSIMPTIWLRPDLAAQIEEDSVSKIRYPCPVYKTSMRKGMWLHRVEFCGQPMEFVQ